MYRSLGKVMEPLVSPTFIDLFSGAGLFSAGLMQAGFRPALAIDLAPDAIASYRRNVAACAVVGSVANAIVDPPQVDVVIAGPPCQGFSTLGRQDPKDARNDLSLSILPWVERAAPSIVVVENVPPFLKSIQWRRLARRLRHMGYASVATWELDAADFGTPQRRRRAFTVASRIGYVAPPSPSHSPATAGAVLDLPVAAGDPMHRWPVATGVAAQRIALIPPLGDKRDVLRLRPDLCPPSWERVGCHATDVWGRIDPSQPSNTLRCTFQNPSKGRYIHPVEDRVISLREGARLQGIPDDWVFEGKAYPVARQIGNGVPIPLAKAVGTALSEALGAACQTLAA